MTASIVTASRDPFTRGLDYLYGVRGLALEPEMIDLIEDEIQRVLICTWIGSHIEAVNQQLNDCLQACHECFHPWEHPLIQIYAAPIAQSYGLDACCNFQTCPYTILVDTGRMVPQHWLQVVVHEYAHAHVGSPGHHQQFAQSLTHLCLGLEMLPPPPEAIEACLRSYPPCGATQDPLAFWRGEQPDWHQ